MVQPLGNLFIVAAPSGAGKSSLISALLSHENQQRLINPAELSVSHTTRSRREKEIHGQHYYYVDESTFVKMIESDQFYEHANVFGHRYGTSKQAISDKVAKGKDVFLDIDWQGARQVRALNPDVTSIFIVPPSVETLRQRLELRAQDSQAVIDKRMAQAKAELSHAEEFDYIIVNDDFDNAVNDLTSIVRTSSLQKRKQLVRHTALFSALNR